MPIRFRCAYCNQLMGIARRKAGTVVRCPKCAGQVVVPDPGGAPELPDGTAEPPASPQPTNPQPVPSPKAEADLFEQSDFGREFEPRPQIMSQPPLPRPVQAHASPAPLQATASAYDAVPLGPGLGIPTRGIFLTPGVLAIVCVLVVVLMGLAFFLGLLMGRSG